MDDLEAWFDVPWPPTAEHLREVLDEICTDAHGDSEQIMALATAFEDHAALPVAAALAGQSIRLEAVEDRDVFLVARIRPPSGKRVAVPLEDVQPAEGTPAAFLVAAWRLWRGLSPIVEPVTSDGATNPPDLRTRIEGLPRATVDGLVLRLCAATPANRALVHEALGLLPTGAATPLLASSKAKIGRFVAPGPDDSFQLEAALDVIEHYSAQTEDAAGEAELLVHFLASGVAASRAYGDLFSEFYDAMGEAASRCGDMLESDEGLARRFLPAVSALLADADRRLSDESLQELLARIDEG